MTFRQRAFIIALMFHVKHYNCKGFVNVAKKPKEEIHNAYINGSGVGVTLYADPTIIVGTLSYNDRVTTGESKNGFTFVKNEKVLGYVPDYYITRL